MILQGECMSINVNCTRLTAKYNIRRLVYFAESNDVQAALAREKQIEGWLRKKKVALIESVNPKWTDLSSDWYKDEILRSRSE